MFPTKQCIFFILANTLFNYRLLQKETLYYMRKGKNGLLKMFDIWPHVLAEGSHAKTH